MPFHQSHPLGEVIYGALIMVGGVLVVIFRARMAEWFEQYSGSRRRRFERTERIYLAAGLWVVAVGLYFVIRGAGSL